VGIPSYVVEPQTIFVDFLKDVLTDAGLEVLCVDNRVDPHRLLEVQPRMLFIDLDFTEEPDPLEAIRKSRAVLPEALICVYTDNQKPGWPDSCQLAGANGVLSKASKSDEVADGIRMMIICGNYTDPRAHRVRAASL
jgi:DNA-binding NarL/FixJ family response regulator